MYRVGFRDYIQKLQYRLFRKPYYEGFSLEPIKRSEFEISKSQRERSEISRLFFNHEGRLVDKWIHYLDVYECELPRFKDHSPTLIEIGIYQGGSLEMWRHYFGEKAILAGIDVDSGTKDNVSLPTLAFIGDQADEEFLAEVLSETGDPDIVIDDGSHNSYDQIDSFKYLFMKLREGGIYIIEDAHTAYWPGHHAGGYKRKNSVIEFCKDLVDDIHAEYHGRTKRHPDVKDVGSIRFYDSMIVVEKRSRGAAVRVVSGSQS